MNRRFKFDNGYEASVVQFPGTYGYTDNLWELAVIHHDQLCYNTIVTDNVIGHLTGEEVLDLLIDIRELPADPECVHT